MAYVAPKMFGGKDAKTPVEGMGIESPSQSPRFSYTGMTRLGEDLLLEFDCSEEGMKYVYRNR